MDENLKEEYLELKQEISEYEVIINSLLKNDSVKKFLSLKKNKAVREYLKIVSDINSKKELLNSMNEKLNDRRVKCNHPTLYMLNKENDIYTCKCLDCEEVIKGKLYEFDIDSIININENLRISSDLDRYKEVKKEYDSLRENRCPRPVIIKKLTKN